MEPADEILTSLAGGELRRLIVVGFLVPLFGFGGLLVAVIAGMLPAELLGLGETVGAVVTLTLAPAIYLGLGSIVWEFWRPLRSGRVVFGPDALRVGPEGRERVIPYERLRGWVKRNERVVLVFPEQGSALAFRDVDWPFDRLCALLSERLDTLTQARVDQALSQAEGEFHFAEPSGRVWTSLFMGLTFLVGGAGLLSMVALFEWTLLSKLEIAAHALVAWIVAGALLSRSAAARRCKGVTLTRSGVRSRARPRSEETPWAAVRGLSASGDELQVEASEGVAVSATSELHNLDVLKATLQARAGVALGARA